MLQNTENLILILHYRNGQDHIAKVRRNIFVLIQQKNNIQIENVLPTVNPDIDSVPRCFMLKWITWILQVNYKIMPLHVYLPTHTRAHAHTHTHTHTKEPCVLENNFPHTSPLKYNSLQIKGRTNSDRFLKVEFEHTETKEPSAKRGWDGAQVHDRFLVCNPWS
jgi:hypothetical protein